MKRLATGTFLIGIAVIVTTGAVVAQHGGMMKGKHGDDEGKSCMHGRMMHGKMMQGSMMGKMRGHDMNGMMMGRMMQKKVIPTEDGGVVVMMGNKLVKYNRNLKKKGEATIKMSEEDMEQMMKNMQKMRKKCMQMMSDEKEEEEK